MMSSLAGQLTAVADRDALSDVVRTCVRDGLGIVVTGGEQPPPFVPGDDERARLSLARLDRVIDHDARDLTLTCEAGLTVDEAARHVLGAGQRLGFEVPDPERYTIGGVIAGRVDGFGAALFGPVRDQILGLHAVLTSGEEIKSGGRVVKNVTGYDLAKLFTGSHGTLGVITEVTLRLRPQPAATRTVLFSRLEAGEALELALRLRDLSATISGLAVAGGDAVAENTGPWLTLLRLEGYEQTVDDAVRGASRIGGEARVLEGDAANDLWRGLARFPTEQPFWCRLHLAPSRLARAETRLTASAESDHRGVVVDVPAGILHFTLPTISRDVITTCGELVLARLARDLGGHVCVPSDPLDLAQRTSRFGEVAPGLDRIERRIQDAFDPSGLMGAGRRREIP